MTEAQIIALAARSTKAVDENYLSARLQIDTIRHAIDNLSADLSILRDDDAYKGTSARADFRYTCNKLDKALDCLDAASERLAR